MKNKISQTFADVLSAETSQDLLRVGRQYLPEGKREEFTHFEIWTQVQTCRNCGGSCESFLGIFAASCASDRKVTPFGVGRVGNMIQRPGDSSIGVLKRVHPLSLDELKGAIVSHHVAKQETELCTKCIPNFLLTI